MGNEPTQGRVCLGTGHTFEQSGVALHVIDVVRFAWEAFGTHITLEVITSVSSPVILEIGQVGRLVGTEFTSMNLPLSRSHFLWHKRWWKVYTSTNLHLLPFTWSTLTCVL